jgi:hypothetical protein
MGGNRMNKLYITKIHLVIEAISYVLLIASIIVLAVGSHGIDGEVATHYDIAGNADAYGSVASLFIMPVIILFTSVILSLVVHFFPLRYWSMPFKVNLGREIKVYRYMTLMMILIIFVMSAATLVSSVAMLKSNGLLITAACIGMVVMMTMVMVVMCILAGKANK